MTLQAKFSLPMAYLALAFHFWQVYLDFVLSEKSCCLLRMSSLMARYCTYTRAKTGFLRFAEKIVLATNAQGMTSFRRKSARCAGRNIAVCVETALSQRHLYNSELRTGSWKNSEPKCLFQRILFLKSHFIDRRTLRHFQVFWVHKSLNKKISTELREGGC